MDSAASEKSIIALDRWLQSPAGAYVRAWEQACLDELTVDIFGFNAVQIGVPQIDALAANRMPNKWQAATRTSTADELAYASKSKQIAVALDFAELPFASQSLDLVVLPHVLEFAAEPHQVLREVERVLIPEGQVIICGFNPASLWGVRQGMGRITSSDYLPAAGEFISMPRLKDWFKLLAFEVDRGRFGCYAPPCQTDKWLRRWSFMEAAGDRWWPVCGAAYVVSAVKRVAAVRLVGPVWKQKKKRVRRGAVVTSRHSDC